MEEIDDFLFVWFNEAWVKLMCPFNYWSKEVSNEFIHHILLLVSILVVILQNLKCSQQKNLHRLVAFLCVSSANKINQQLTQDLLKSDDGEILGLNEHIGRVAFTSNSKLDFFHEIWLFDIIMGQSWSVFHKDLKVLEDTLITVLTSSISSTVLVLELLLNKLFQGYLVEEYWPILSHNIYSAWIWES